MNNSRVSPCKYSDMLYVCLLFQACFTATTHLFNSIFIYLLVYLFLCFLCLIFLHFYNRVIL